MQVQDEELRLNVRRKNRFEEIVMSKVLWLDTETSGLDPKVNGIIEIAGILYINDQQRTTIDLQLNPKTYKRKIKIEKEALKINGYTKKKLKKLPNSVDQFDIFISFLDDLVNKFDKNDKIIIAGYNSRFDTDFLREWFKDNNNDFYGSYFYNYDNDVFAFVKKLWAQEKIVGLQNLKLPTLANYFNIPLEAHIAMEDIRATIELDRVLTKMFMKGQK